MESQWDSLPYDLKVDSLLEFFDLFDAIDEICDPSVIDGFFHAVSCLMDVIIGSGQLQFDVLRCLASASLHFDPYIRQNATLVRIWSCFKEAWLAHLDECIDGMIIILERQYVSLISEVLDDTVDKGGDD